MEYIVEGSVRISGKNLRVNATLINAIDHKSIWSESYDDNFKIVIQVQDQIASQIVSQLNKRITKTQLENDLKNLPLLENDTKDIIEYRNDIEVYKKKRKNYNFWDLIRK